MSTETTTNPNPIEDPEKTGTTNGHPEGNKKPVGEPTSDKQPED